MFDKISYVTKIRDSHTSGRRYIYSIKDSNFRRGWEVSINMPFDLLPKELDIVRRLVAVITDYKYKGIFTPKDVAIFYLKYAKTKSITITRAQFNTHQKLIDIYFPHLKYGSHIRCVLNQITQLQFGQTYINI